MRRAIVLCVLALALTAPAAAQQVQVESFRLDNGMEFLLLPRAEEPNQVMAGWVARVGSVNERPGITGISHFFEHMMFKGTTTIGTRDPQADAAFAQQQHEVRGKLRELHLTTQYARWKAGEIADPWDPANDTAEMQDLRAQLKKLMDDHRAVIVKDEFDQVYTAEGGSRMNAFTSHDVTFYFINVPANKLELWAWMESDRLSDSVFREFYSERDVVHEERRLRTESTPTGIFQEQFDALFWQSSPYSWPVIGWTSDLNSYTIEQARAYFDIYYRPNNLVGVMVGDFDPATVKPQLVRYFGRLTAGSPPPPVVTLEAPQIAEKRMYAECDCQPQVEVRYHTVPFGHADEAALEVMSSLLNGDTGRLYKALVEEQELAVGANVQQDSRKYAGAFSFSAECKADATPQQLEDAWYEQLARLQSELVPAEELQKVKNQQLANSYRRLQSNNFLMIQLGYFEALGGWEYINTAPEKLQAVQAEDVMRVAKKYFAKENRSVVSYTRKAGSTTSEDPALASLDPEIRNMVKQQVKQLAQVEDPEQIKTMLARMTEQQGQVPAAFKPAVEYVISKAQQRLEELESAKNK
ncbi:MAG: M16 family metallopeptidase [Planctomycetota bacterium]